MKRLLVLLLLVTILLFSSNGKGIPRVVQYNIEDAFGISYDFTTPPDYLTFNAMIVHGDSVTITEQSPGSSFEMVSSDSFPPLSTIVINLGDFSTWEVGQELYIDLRDEGGLKVKNTKDFCGWYAMIIPEGVDTLHVGFEPYIPATGYPITMGSCGSIDENGYTPESTNLKQNYPNPFNPTTTIEFDIEKKGMVSLNIYNQEGKIVRNAVDNFMNAGEHSASVDLSNLSAGNYYYILKVDGVSEAKKMVLVK